MSARTALSPLRSARLEQVARLIGGYRHGFVLNEESYRSARDYEGLTRAQLDLAVDDLVAADRAELLSEGSGPLAVRLVAGGVNAATATELDVTGPIPDRLALSAYAAPATTSTTPTRRSMSWAQLAIMLSEHERRSDKDGQGWSPITYKPGTTRANRNVVEVSAAVGDFDHKTVDDYQEIRRRIERLGLTYSMYSTYSSTPDELAFRVVIPYTGPVDAARANDIWHRVNEHVFGGQNDPQTKDPSRMFYRPACPHDALPFAEHHDGLALDPNKLPAATYAAPEYRNGAASNGAVDHIGYATYEFITFGAEIGHQRGAALAATRACLAAGHNVEETAGLVWRGLQASPQGDTEDPWTYERALELAEDLDKREPTPLPRPTILEPASQVAPAFRHTAAQPGGNGRVPTDAPVRFRRRAYHRTDTGNAERLVDRHGAVMRFCHPQAQWYVYDTRRWARDQTGAARQLAKETVRAMLAEASTIEDDEKRKELVKWAFGSESSEKISSLLKQAQSEPGIPILTDAMDRDPWLFNCLDGTIDLRTGALRPHDPADTITKLAPVHYDPDATCPRFEAFLKRIVPDPNVRAFRQRTAGYSLTADTSEQCLFFLHGSGNNGESTFLAILQSLFGDYGCQAAPELLEASRSSRHPTELADLFGARFVATIEVDEGKQMAESLVKQMTGGDRMKARFMRENFFEFDPTHKIFLAANHKPTVRGDDEGIWRRIHLVPFGVAIPRAERDKHLVAKLREELPGILQWALRGCLEWRQSGLGVPEAVAEASAAYRAEQDAVGAFLSECCVLHIDEWVPTAWLRESYEAWCKERGEKPLAGSSFSDRLRDKGCSPKSGRAGDRVVRGWGGLRMKLDSEL